MTCMTSTASVTSTWVCQFLFKDSPATSITLYNFHGVAKRQMDLSLVVVWPNSSIIQEVALGVTHFA